MSQDLSDYVYLDAKERAFEIEIEARKEYEKKKEEIVEKKLATLEDEFRKKRDNKESQRRIAHSNLVNKSRTQKLNAKNKAILKLLNESQLALAKKIEDNTFYAKILQGIIVEGLMKLMEPKVFVRCLERDVKVVQSVLKACVTDYKSIVKKELGQNAELELEIDESRPMEMRTIPDFTKLSLEELGEEQERQIKLDKSKDLERCFGGVVLTNDRNTIICKSTLDIRVQQSFADSLPNIREMMFGGDTKR